MRLIKQFVERRKFSLSAHRGFARRGDSLVNGKDKLAELVFKLRFGKDAAEELCHLVGMKAVRATAECAQHDAVVPVFESNAEDRTNLVCLNLPSFGGQIPVAIKEMPLVVRVLIFFTIG